MKQSISLGVLLITVLFAVAQAEVKVGDKPTVALKSADGKSIDNEAIKGWVTVIYFWETDDKYTIESADKLVPAFEAYSRRGVKLVAFNLNKDMKEVERSLKLAKINWPQFNDGQAWKSNVVKTWGFDRPATAYILVPDGTVFWMGHISGLDGPLEDALKKHPPTLSRETTTDLVNKQLKEINRLLEENKAAQDFREPLRLLGNIQSPPLDDPETLVLAKRTLTYFDSKKEQDVNSLKGYLQTYPNGAKMLETFRAALNTAATQPGATKLTPAQVAQQKRREQLAQTKLTAADALRDAGKDIPAYKAYKQVVSVFGDTPAAKAAAERVKAFEGDAAFIEKMKKAQEEESAQGLLQMANSYRDSGNRELARETYEKVIKEFPNSPAAAAARDALEKK